MVADVHLFLLCVLTFLTLRWVTRCFALSQINFSLTIVTISILLSTDISPWVVSGRVNANFCWSCRSFIWFDANCRYHWTPISLICWEVFVKTMKLLSYLRINLLIFLDWFSARAFANLPIMFACITLKSSRLLEKHVVSRLPSNSWQNFCGWRFDGLWKPEGFQAKFIGFFYRVLIISITCHYLNEFRYLMVKYSNY